MYTQDSRRGSKTPDIGMKISKKIKHNNSNFQKQEQFLSASYKYTWSDIKPKNFKTNISSNKNSIQQKSRNNLMKFSTYSEQASIAKFNRKNLYSQNYESEGKFHWNKASMDKSIKLPGNPFVFSSTIDENYCESLSFINSTNENSRFEKYSNSKKKMKEDNTTNFHNNFMRLCSSKGRNIHNCKNFSMNLLVKVQTKIKQIKINKNTVAKVFSTC